MFLFMKNAMNNPNTIILSDESTWPIVVIECLKKHRDLFKSVFMEIKKGLVPWEDYEKATKELHKILLPFNIKGYHCTKLTELEIEQIENDGMKLQDLDSLSKRINDLADSNIISFEIAKKLKKENDANDKNRSKMLWFCFFPPKEAGQLGIERFFRSWGGEALYNSHEDNPDTGKILKKIGNGCIIEANIPISNLNQNSYLIDKVIRNFLKKRGLDTSESCNLVEYSEKNIPASNIEKVFQFPSPQFIELSGCDTWDEPL